MTVLNTLNFFAFNPLQNNNPITVCRHQFIAKIDDQIQLATNKDYTSTQHKWVTDVLRKVRQATEFVELDAFYPKIKSCKKDY